MDDVLVNGNSTGACANITTNNTLGKCLIFTDTGAPLTTVPSELVSAESQAAIAEWLNQTSFSSSVPYQFCDMLAGFPMNLSIVIDGVTFSVTPPDLAIKVGEGSNGRDVCVSQMQQKSLKSLFVGESIKPRYLNLPAPTLFIGNNWLRNFFGE